MDMTDITALLAGIGVGHYDGYAPTGASLPYVVNRPLLIDTVETAINGGAVGWDYQLPPLMAVSTAVQAASTRHSIWRWPPFLPYRVNDRETALLQLPWDTRGLR